ncbi:hypothetical protein MBAV_002364 [Candidatus Magnetobacterium bavaricum]|uniref:Uncharacterized protein n=1 Tax=Candidatus Magnetobacterium bavaricum TaxID=29290 RepID=A0A0F3GUD2_9BACT|nr:hypothetical protein MBAV_002364 [Candidatus Magnetobacterium bavaricum]
MVVRSCQGFFCFRAASHIILGLLLLSKEKGKNKCTGWCIALLRRKKLTNHTEKTRTKD